jgi:cold shock CspA family protein
MQRSPVMTGRVTAFDEAVGLGVITGDDGTEYPFHCVEISDGTRTIDVGAEVEFGALYKLGRVEAAGIRRVIGA